jgi:hypothetical protein
MFCYKEQFSNLTRGWYINNLLLVAYFQAPHYKFLFLIKKKNVTYISANLSRDPCECCPPFLQMLGGYPKNLNILTGYCS